MIELITSGESHGKGIFVTIKGIPSQLKIDVDFINNELSRRQIGYGRGGRMKIETDRTDILAGIINGKTTGSPITIAIWNKDYENWKDKKTPPVLKPRPGHADLIGAYKYGLTDDIRQVLERSSARETSGRVAAGAIAKLFLKEFGIEVFSHVVNLGGIDIDTSIMNYSEIRERSEKSELRCAAPPAIEGKIKERIDIAKDEGDTLGGIIETIVHPIPPFLGSYQSYEEKLDALIARSVLSIQAVKGIEFGLGFKYAYISGKNAHDEIFFDAESKKYFRKTNRAGGIEGGMSNGNAVVFRSVMKPIPTLMSPLNTINISTKEIEKAITERSDVTAVPACGVIIEAVTAIEVANALLKRYGSDNLNQILKNFENDLDLKEFKWK